MVKVLSDSEPPVKFSVWQDEVSAFVGGALVGLATWTLTYLLSEYVIGIIACRSGSSLIGCDDTTVVSAGFALIFASLAGLTFLVRRRLFRPLLVVLAATVTLWGMNGSWLEERTLGNVLLTMLVAATIYLMFGWFSKIRQFGIAIAVTVALVIVFRLLLAL